MIDAISFLILVLASVGLSHVVLPCDHRIRLFFIVMPGVLLLFITHPLALLLAVLSFLVCCGIFLVGRAVDNRRIRTRVPYLILLMLFLPDLSRLATDAPILWLGSAFFIIRQMMTVEQALKKAIGFRQLLPGLAIATFFFAALPSGPVFDGSKIWERLKQNAAPNYAEGCYRLLEGTAFLFAIAGFATVAISATEILALRFEQSGVGAAALPAAAASALAAFGFLFATFYGYSRMAEGSALLFGFEVPQNFNKPHLARDLGEFWKRWHRSMADFVMQYIYLPLLVTTSNARLALIAAFVFMGLWHNFSLGFALWGLGHGIGLSIVLPWAKRAKVPPAIIRIASLAYVVLLSSVAHEVWFE